MYTQEKGKEKLQGRELAYLGSVHKGEHFQKVNSLVGRGT